MVLAVPEPHDVTLVANGSPRDTLADQVRANVKRVRKGDPVDGLLVLRDEAVGFGEQINPDGLCESVSVRRGRSEEAILAICWAAAMKTVARAPVMMVVDFMLMIEVCWWVRFVRVRLSVACCACSACLSGLEL